ncbi:MULTISPECIES: Acb2/Tad1 domain-containing protein [Mycolicibacterium]|jgi:hypothetical protein|uniref:Acb2/Tad1 hairpin domain-containing protein n=3 Tax=Mycolicibacterium TaxID=1866885 RepID=A0AAE4VHP6_MYCFO|nr:MULTISPECIES: hypothetical protein [Mycolicibacterium]KLI04518.1 hypothetical protein AA982_29460 [Mycolicibacterium senegalense]KLO53838.1 hypothetical protein ABW05_22470 [Mycolicibacterium senegalense]KMV16350.1 hypothetical protein ACT17_20495 [Mycolicibacterium conceptionense]MDV7194301.1 hypothetical protein [Mycolicibacterium fortuitum]MDV7294280.1 hypothetical protein [Mycolicibacterium fortuitum]
MSSNATAASTADLVHRFAYHRPDTEKVKAHEDVRARCGDLAHHLDHVLSGGREKALAITKLEEVMFWANAAIARSKGDG